MIKILMTLMIMMMIYFKGELYLLMIKYNMSNDIVKCSCKMDTGACYAMPEKSKKKNLLVLTFLEVLKIYFLRKIKSEPEKTEEIMI